MINENIVSLITPCFNGEKFLDDYISNILKQTYCDKIELIFVDDGSTDDSSGKISKYQVQLDEKLWNFIYIKQDNQGVGSAVNNALKFVSGEFIALMDVDDTMLPNAIEIKANYLKKNMEYSAVLNNGYYLYEDGKTKLFYNKDNLPSANVFNDIINGNIVNWPGSYMIRTSDWLTKYPDREIYASRYGQNIQMLLPVTYNAKVGYIDEPLMYYFVHSNSMTHSKDVTGEKQLENSYGFEDIYFKIINIFFNGKELEKINNIISATFARSRMNIGINKKNDAIIRQYYLELKKTNLMTLDDKINYNSYFFPFRSFVLKCIRKLKSYLFLL